MIGDPSGRSDERNLLDEETLRANVARPSRSRSPGSSTPTAPRAPRSSTTGTGPRTSPCVDFLRDVGKHVTVNQMTARDSVRNRLESEQGISYTEFTYMLLQAQTTCYLHDVHGCELQIGGSDQWGNIVVGRRPRPPGAGRPRPRPVLAAPHRRPTAPSWASPPAPASGWPPTGRARTSSSST